VGDYAVCTGTTGFDYTVILPDGPPVQPTGAFQAVTGVRFAAITDGLSNTLLVGEKHVPRGSEGLPPWDCGVYDGHNPACFARAAGPGLPLAMFANDSSWRFGSRHPGICHFVFGDGSVRALPTGISPRTLGLLAHRADGQVIPPID
jgi:hypothetical protein